MSKGRNSAWQERARKNEMYTILLHQAMAQQHMCHGGEHGSQSR